MRSRVLAIDKMLHTLQEMSDRCQRERIKVPRMRNCRSGLQEQSQQQEQETKQGSSKIPGEVKNVGNDDDGAQGSGATSYQCCCEHDAIMNQVVDIETHVKIVRNSLLFLCRSYLLEKQIV